MRLTPGMCAAIVADSGESLAAGGIRTNGAWRFEQPFLTVGGSTPRL
jgi:hypothetical protein